MTRRSGARRAPRLRVLVFILVAGWASASAAQQTNATLRVSPQSAVAMALANNVTLESARRGPEIADLDVVAAESAWKPAVLASIGHSGTDSPASTSFDRALKVVTDREITSELSLYQQLPWGASYDVGWTSLRRSNNSLLNSFQPQISSLASARVTQPLLRGFTIDDPRAARARSLVARDSAGFALEASVAALRREVLYAFWQWIYTRDYRAVAKEALALAQALLDGNRERVAARAMAATDVIEAEAEVARRDEAVLVAEKNVANAEDHLRLLILNPNDPNYLATLEPVETTAGGVPVSGSEVETQALDTRTDLKTLRNGVRLSALDARQFRNDSLPDVNVSAGFTTQGVGGTELIRDPGLGTPVTGATQRGLGLVLGDLGRLRYPGWSVELSVGYQVGTAVAKANAARASVEQRQRELAVAALEQEIDTEVRAAQREVTTNEQRLKSTNIAVALAERRLAGEEEKFLVGLSTSFFVFQAQRDLASARVAQLGAELERRLSTADLAAVQLIPLPGRQQGRP